ncbi:MAG: hypothetical protein HQ523_05645, partial [Lentisphaerae bacterium]|nr:hypothetical protein [Lentisphaerota bacterium]
MNKKMLFSQSLLALVMFCHVQRIDKQSLFGRGGHLRLKTVLKQGFHGSEDAGIGMGSQDRVKITL